jgi:hypothetical protein
MDGYGRVLWQGQISDVTALIPVGTSPHVIIIQRAEDGRALLTRFASHARSLHPIGKLGLTAHHDVTSESQWLVQIGGDIGALDLVKLCATEPEIELLWSCALTDRVQVVAFFHDPVTPRWITRDISGERAPLLELWSLQNGRELKASLCKLPAALAASPFRTAAPTPPLSGEAVNATTNWFWRGDYGGNRIGTMGTDSKWMEIQAWSAGFERDVTQDLAARMRAGTLGSDAIQSCDFQRAYAGDPTPQTGEGRVSLLLTSTGPNGAKLTLDHDPATPLVCLARGAKIATRGERGDFGDRSAIMLLADEAGRLLMVDLDGQRLTIM